MIFGPHIGDNAVAIKDALKEQFRVPAISVTGSKVEMGGTEVILAREITKGDQVLTLRDPQGFPLWSGRMQRSP